MKQNGEDKKKLDRGQERITHKIARDLEKADRKRKAEEEVKEAAGQGTTAEVENEEVPNKKAKPSQEEENIDVEMVPNNASSSGLAGGAGGASGETLKRKREGVDSDPGIDIDRLENSNGAKTFRREVISYQYYRS